MRYGDKICDMHMRLIPAGSKCPECVAYSVDRNYSQVPPGFRRAERERGEAATETLPKSPPETEIERTTEHTSPSEPNVVEVE